MPHLDYHYVNQRLTELAQHLPRRTWWGTGLQGLWLVAFLAVLSAAWLGAEIKPLELVNHWRNSAEFAAGFLRPDFTYWKSYLADLWVTLSMALWGTLLAILAAIPLGLAAAANISPWWIRQPVRRLLDFGRAVNELIFALLFCVAVGLGPFAGTLALFVHTTGILGKLFSEAVEAIDPRPVEGIRATGASHLHEILYGVVPQVVPLWISYSLYRFESNVRSASVVGMIGAGGIGMTLQELIRGFYYAQTAAVLLLVVVAVIILDLISARIRAFTL